MGINSIACIALQACMCVASAAVQVPLRPVWKVLQWRACQQMIV